MKHILLTLLALTSLSSFAASEECEKYINEATIAAYDLASSDKIVEFGVATEQKPEVIEPFREMRQKSSDNFAAMRAKASEVCK